MWHSKNEKLRLEKMLEDKSLSFSGAYMALRSFHDMAVTDPAAIDFRSVSVLQGMLENATYCRQTQALGFYREAAMILHSVLLYTPSPDIFDSAFTGLKNIMAHGGSIQHRAASEALGALPLKIKGPAPFHHLETENTPVIHWQSFLAQNTISENAVYEYKGRSLVLNRPGNTVLVVKYAKSRKDAKLLDQEAKWMAYLGSGSDASSAQFHVPKPIQTDGCYIFKPCNFPHRKSVGSIISNDGFKDDMYAMAYVASQDYFAYPNSRNKQDRLDPNRFYKTITANAGHLGQMAQLGIIHTAPIPLFHNRTQARRRNDRGRYEWPRGGRLDRWLHSCQYPNFSLSGVRDFEHLTGFNGPDRLFYLHVGTHILSLILVMGSYFRNKNPECVGFDSQGRPADARGQFEPAAFKKLIEAAFKSYYKSFVSMPFKEKIPIDSAQLTRRLIEEMGQDRYMEEVLRTSDQQAMTDETFEDFLMERDFTYEGIKALSKGQQDITILSGPHLGAFNGRISVPELIRFLSVAAATCIADKFYYQRRKELH